MAQHIVNISGGKDSQACAALAALRGRPFKMVMADTGNENDITLRHIQDLEAHFGQSIYTVKADFSERIAQKRQYIQEHWPADGVPQEHVDRAIDILQPTGNPFLDLCIWKGRFPSRLAQFCTEFLKVEAVRQQILDPALEDGPVIQWLGIRRDESANRAKAPRLRIIRSQDGFPLINYSPIIHWTAENVVGFSRKLGIPLNPLYSMGMGRGGCFPCINAKKRELAEIFSRFPDEIERLKEWESIVAMASKRGAATFFAPGMTPDGREAAREFKRRAELISRRDYPDETGPKLKARIKRISAELAKGHPWPDAQKAAEWAKTDRGGRQTNLEFEEPHTGCTSEYGLCE